MFFTLDIDSNEGKWDSKITIKMVQIYQREKSQGNLVHFILTLDEVEFQEMGQ